MPSHNLQNDLNDNESKCKYLKRLSSMASHLWALNQRRTIDQGDRRQMFFYTWRVGRNNGFISPTVCKVMRVKPRVTQCLLEEKPPSDKRKCSHRALQEGTAAGSRGRRTTSTLSDKQDTHEPHGDPLKTACHQSSAGHISASLTAFKTLGNIWRV